MTKGFEGEANVYLTRGLSFYINGTVGNAKYVSQMIPTARVCWPPIPTTTCGSPIRLRIRKHSV